MAVPRDRSDNKRLRTVYFDKREIAALEKVALANGQSANAATRIIVRHFLGLPAPQLVIGDELRAELGLE